jgi:hypothetical protein
VPIYTRRAIVRRRPAAGGTDPYPWYSPLDRNQIPFHVAAGPWGAQLPLQSPTAPTINDEVTGISSAAEFNAARASNRRLVFDASFNDPISLDNLSHVELVIPSGINLGALVLGGNNQPISHIRIRGSTIGQHSGGRIGRIWSINSPLDDFIIDGIDLNGAHGATASNVDHCLLSGNGPGGGQVQNSRWAIVNCRFHSAAACFLGSVNHIVFANCNLFHGARTRAQNAADRGSGFAEGWGIRNQGGPIVVYNSRIEGTRYHNLRCQPLQGGQYGDFCWINSSKLVNVYEAQTAWIFGDLGLSLVADGSWFLGNQVYTQMQASCPNGRSLANVVTGGADLPYGRWNNNAFYGSGTNAVYDDAYFALVESNEATGNVDFRTGNTYNALVNPGAWGGPGDPTLVSLPGGVAPTLGEDFCTFPGY